MKKAIVLALTLLGTASFASTINWGFNTKSYFGSDSVGKNATGYLVYLGTGENATWEKTETDYKAIAEGTSTSYTDKKTSSLGKISGSIDIAAGTPVYTGSSAVFTDGSSVFGVMMTYTENETTYYNLGGTFTFDTSDTEHYEAVPSDMFTWSSAGPASNSDTAAQGWKAVPEPSVALMGLLGLGMLLKRRRA